MKEKPPALFVQRIDTIKLDLLKKSLQSDEKYHDEEDDENEKDIDIVLSDSEEETSDLWRDGVALLTGNLQGLESDISDSDQDFNNEQPSLVEETLLSSDGMSTVEESYGEETDGEPGSNKNSLIEVESYVSSEDSLQEAEVKTPKIPILQFQTRLMSILGMPRLDVRAKKERKAMKINDKNCPDSSAIGNYICRVGDPGWEKASSEGEEVDVETINNVGNGESAIVLRMEDVEHSYALPEKRSSSALLGERSSSSSFLLEEHGSSSSSSALPEERSSSSNSSALPEKRSSKRLQRLLKCPMRFAQGEANKQTKTLRAKLRKRTEAQEKNIFKKRRKRKLDEMTREKADSQRKDHVHDEKQRREEMRTRFCQLKDAVEIQKKNVAQIHILKNAVALISTLEKKWDKLKEEMQTQRYKHAINTAILKTHQTHERPLPEKLVGVVGKAESQEKRQVKTNPRILW